MLHDLGFLPEGDGGQDAGVLPRVVATTGPEAPIRGELAGRLADLDAEVGDGNPPIRRQKPLDQEEDRRGDGLPAAERDRSCEDQQGVARRDSGDYFLRTAPAGRRRSRSRSQRRHRIEDSEGEEDFHYAPQSVGSQGQIAKEARDFPGRLCGGLTES